jgi:hypothetical protein
MRGLCAGYAPAHNLAVYAHKPLLHFAQSGQFLDFFFTATPLPTHNPNKIKVGRYLTYWSCYDTP